MVLFQPEFTNSGINITLKILGSAFEKNLRNVNEEYWLPSDITNLRDAFVEIADHFKIIPDKSQRSIRALFPFGEINRTDFTGGKKELRFPSKPRNQTGLDYLADVFKKFPPTFGIEREAAFARFNPFGNDREGTFEIIPASRREIRRIYRWNGVDSRIFSFTPKLLPFKRDNYKQGDQISYTDSETKENVREVSDVAAGESINRKYGAETTTEIAKARAEVEQNVLFSNIYTAELPVLSDINILPHDLVQVDIYNKLSGRLESSNVFGVYGITHRLVNGQLETNLLLANAEYKPIIDNISKGVKAITINLEDIEFGKYIESLKDAISEFIPKF